MKLILLPFLCLLCTSCSYQYFTLSSEHMHKDENNDFVLENDTLRLTYHFSGDHGPVQITIYNKTNDPLEIDWKKSALVMDERAYSYYSPNLFLNGNVQQDTLMGHNHSFFTDVKADIYVNESSQFIPPRSSISKIPLSLPVYPVELPPGEPKKNKYVTSEDYIIKYKKIEYGPEKSPISFRSYLSFNYAGNKLKEFSIDHHFYVSAIWESGSSPEYFPQEIIGKGNVFHLVQ